MVADDVALRATVEPERRRGIAGTVLVLYATLLAPLIPDAAAHFVIASVLGAPAAILVSLIMVPETSDKRTGGSLEDPEMEVSGTMDAIVKGTSAGLELLLNIVAMLLVLVFKNDITKLFR